MPGVPSRQLAQFAGGRILFYWVIPRVCVERGIPGTEIYKLLRRELGYLNLDLSNLSHTLQACQNVGLMVNAMVHARTGAQHNCVR